MKLRLLSTVIRKYFSDPIQVIGIPSRDRGEHSEVHLRVMQIASDLTALSLFILVCVIVIVYTRYCTQVVGSFLPPKSAVLSALYYRIFTSGLFSGRE